MTPITTILLAKLKADKYQYRLPKAFLSCPAIKIAAGGRCAPSVRLRGHHAHIVGLLRWRLSGRKFIGWCRNKTRGLYLTRNALLVCKLPSAFSLG